MDNIYGQTERERNAVVELPEGFAEGAGNTLYGWLGSLWRGLHDGDGLVRGLHRARGLRLAQLYLDILEAARLQDRNGAPVFHRELWHPIVVRLSRRDTSSANMVSVGVDGVVGGQPSGSEYGEGTVFRLGRRANFESYVTYPIDDEIAGGALSIVDNIVNPTVSFERGPDFEIRAGAIIFRKEDDPLRDGTPFDRYDLPGVLDDGGEPVSDMEAVLWASDVLVDRGYIADHISYALGARAPSSDVVKRILNAAWSSVTGGLTPELVRTLLAAMMNIPVIQNESETVVDVSDEEEEWKDADSFTRRRVVAQVVTTDAGTYRVSPKARLLKSVVPGAVLRRGDLLDESLRIYPLLNRSLGADCGFSVPLEQDVPSVSIPPGMIRARTENGVYAMWAESRVRDDAIGRPFFDIGGDPSDVKAFWEDVWSRAAAEGTDLHAVVGEAGSVVRPAEFLLRNLVGANTLFVVVDASQADDLSMMRDPMFFDMLSAVVPAAVRLFLVEHAAVGGDEDLADIGGLAEQAACSAAIPFGADMAKAASELVSMRFVRPRPALVRGTREEET